MFPATPVLDPLNLRVDENPLSNGGLWAGPIFPADAPMQRVNRAAAASVNGVACESYVTTLFGPDVEVFQTINVFPSAANPAVEIFLRIANPGLGGVTCYSFRVFLINVSWNRYQFSRFDGAARILLATLDGGPAMNPGDQLGARMIGSLLVGFVNGTPVDAGHSDSTYKNVGFIGMRVDETSAALNNFGGGTAMNTYAGCFAQSAAAPYAATIYG